MYCRTKFRSQTSDLWTDAATVVGEQSEKRKAQKRNSHKRKSQ